MKRLFPLIVLFIITGCTLQQLVAPAQPHETSVKFTTYEADSLRTVMQQKDVELDSLYALVGELSFTIDSLATALDISNSRIAVNQDFQIPDSMIFAGTVFDFTNERYYAKFEKIFKQELKSAHKFIPRSGKYFTIIDSILTAHNIPLDAKYLAVAESNLSPMATSRVGAAGIWQFMKSTGTGYGMKVDSFVDERRDVFISTVAAAKHLQNCYNYMAKRGAEDWLLAISSYNSGAGNIAKIVKNQGGDSFFELIMGSSETHNYVWRAAAIKLIFDNEEAIYGKKLERQAPLMADAKMVSVTLKGHYKIDDWAIAQGTTVGRVCELNPWIKIYQRSRQKYSALTDVVLPPGTFNVLVPKDATPEPSQLASLEKQFLNKNAGFFTHHVVKSGDNLYNIARKYNTTVAKIKSLNGLSSNVIHPGQKLKLYGTPGGSSESRVYVVKRGDSVSSIAYNLGVKTSSLISQNKLSTKNGVVMIYPGQKLYY
jgi:membrane-bound lytic murein transglycosylase D